MSTIVMPREDVHRLAEDCSDSGDAFRAVASRLLRDQKRLTNFLKRNMPELDQDTREVVLYMFAVCIRVFEQYGGRLKKVSGSEIDASAEKVRALAAEIMPFDGGFPERVRKVEWRAQPHLLDEALWALFEREDREEGELDVPPDQAGMIFLLLWVAVESLDSHWTPPS
ncbi:MAG: hypothetical protein VX519_10310 [Myxococcota bacterium]|nr:hypothetical protein [Myxococcota bacterium]